MSYEPTTWTNGDIITATKLNNIESGVQSVSSNYTPTTWANGDIITATKLNNIEQGIVNAEGGGGGGGSSDFSTATVTLNAGGTIGFNLSSAVIDLSSSWDLEPNTLPPVITRLDTESPQGVSSYTVALYQGHTLAFIYTDEASVQGNAQRITDIEDLVALDITGDCTITIS